MRIYLKNNPAEFHSDPIRNDGVLDFIWRASSQQDWRDCSSILKWIRIDWRSQTFSYDVILSRWRPWRRLAARCCICSIRRLPASPPSACEVIVSLSLRSC